MVHPGTGSAAPGMDGQKGAWTGAIPAAARRVWLFGGGFRHTNSFIEVMKGLIDQLNAFCSKDPNSFAPSTFTRGVNSMHFYDSIVVIEKQMREEPKRVICGTPSFPDVWDGGDRLTDAAKG